MRDYHVLSYAEYLRSDSGLWRIMADYMYSCNEIGKHQADEILVRIPMRLKSNTANNDAAPNTSIEEVGVLAELNDTCREHRREALRRTICRASRNLFPIVYLADSSM